MYYSSGAYHGALDYGIDEGSTVYAAADGVVLYAGYTEYPGSNRRFGIYDGYTTCKWNKNSLWTW